MASKSKVKCKAQAMTNKKVKHTGIPKKNPKEAKKPTVPKRLSANKATTKSAAETEFAAMMAQRKSVYDRLEKTFDKHFAVSYKASKSAWEWA